MLGFELDFPATICVQVPIRSKISNDNAVAARMVFFAYSKHGIFDAKADSHRLVGIQSGQNLHFQFKCVLVLLGGSAPLQIAHCRRHPSGMSVSCGHILRLAM